MGLAFASAFAGRVPDQRSASALLLGCCHPLGQVYTEEGGIVGDPAGYLMASLGIIVRSIEAYLFWKLDGS